MKYESSISYHSKVIAKVKDFLRTNSQMDKRSNRKKTLGKNYMPMIYQCGYIKSKGSDLEQ